MEEPRPNNSESHANDGKVDSSALSETTDQVKIANPKKATADAEKEVTKSTPHSWRVWEAIKPGWAIIKSPESTNLIMAAATVVIAVFTALTFWLVLGSSQDTQKLITAAEGQASSADEIAGAAHDFTDSAYWMEQHMDDAAKAMQDSVDTAAQNTKTTISNAQKAFHDEQRAWVGVQGTADIKGFTESEPWKVTVVFFNSGRTPARNVQISGMYVTSPIPLSGPSTENIKQLVFQPAQSIAPQGVYRENMGSEVAAEGATAAQHQGAQQLISEYKFIKDK